MPQTANNWRARWLHVRKESAVSTRFRGRSQAGIADFSRKLNAKFAWPQTVAYIEKTFTSKVRKEGCSVDEMESRRELYQGFGSTLSRAMELVVAPLLFAAFGIFLDRALGTSPWLAVGFGVVGVVGGALRIYYAYVEAMKAQNRDKPWSRA